MWVTKLLISPVKKRIFCPKKSKFGLKMAFLFILGQALPAHLVGGCGARAVSRKTPSYFIQHKFMMQEVGETISIKVNIIYEQKEMAEIATVMYLIQPLPQLAVPLLLHLWTKKVQRIMKARRERLEPSRAEDPRLIRVNFCPTNNTKLP